jgi:hypothetical protein
MKALDEIGIDGAYKGIIDVKITDDVDALTALATNARNVPP